MRTTKKNNKIISFLTALVIMLNILPMCIVQADDTVAISTVNDLKEFFLKSAYMTSIQKIRSSYYKMILI